MNTNLNTYQAFAFAVNKLNLFDNDPKLISSSNENGLFYMTIHAGLLSYEVYVGTNDGEIYGLMTEPVNNPMSEVMDLEYRIAA